MGKEVFELILCCLPAIAGMRPQPDLIMNNSVREKITCPSCGQTAIGLICRVITPDSPEFKLLFSGKLNVFSCASCGKSYQVAVEQLIYRDSEHSFLLVQHQPPADTSRYGRIIQEVDAMATEAAMLLKMPRPTVRLVFAREDFLEKIALQRRGFDDRLVEYAKFQLFQNTGGAALLPERHRLLYDFSRSDEEKLQFAVFDRQTHQVSAALHLPQEDYHRMALEFSVNEPLQKELERLFPDCLVSVDRLYPEGQSAVSPVERTADD